MVHSEDPIALLPLKPNWFHILLSLAEGVRHGYAIMQEVSERTNGKLRLWPTTVYGSIKRMEESGLVEQVEFDDPDETDDERRHYYAITSFGRDVLSAEAHRLSRLVELAHARTA
jgi:DNA-binding PadR family transcriptional regulator